MGCWRDSRCNTSGPFPPVGRCGTLARMLVRMSVAVVVDHREPGGSGGRSGGWSVVLSGLRAAVVAVGVRVRARGTDARWCARVAPAAGAVRRLRDYARSAGRLLDRAAARWRGGDRPGAAGQDAGRRAPHDRGATGAPTVHGPRVAARRRAPRRDAVCGARAGGCERWTRRRCRPSLLGRRWPTRSRRSAALYGSGGCGSRSAPGRGSSRSRSPAGCCAAARPTRRADRARGDQADVLCQPLRRKHGWAELVVVC